MSMCNHNSVNPTIRGEGFLKNFLESSLSVQTATKFSAGLLLFRYTFQRDFSAAEMRMCLISLCKSSVRQWVEVAKSPAILLQPLIPRRFPKEISLVSKPSRCDEMAFLPEIGLLQSTQTQFCQGTFTGGF